MRYFVESVCTGYSTLLRAQKLSYRDSLNATVDVALARGEYFGGYRYRVSEVSQDLHFGEGDSDE